MAKEGTRKMTSEEFEKTMNRLYKRKEQLYDQMRQLDDAMILVWEDYDKREKKEIEK